MIAPHCSGETNGLGLPNLTYAAMHALYSSPATGHISAVLRALLDRLDSPLTPDLQLTWPAKPSSSSLSLGLKSSLKAAELCLSKASSLCSLSDNEIIRGSSPHTAVNWCHVTKAGNIKAYLRAEISQFYLCSCRPAEMAKLFPDRSWQVWAVLHAAS